MDPISWGFNLGEVIINFNTLPSDIRNVWVHRFEDEGFGPTPQKNILEIKVSSGLFLESGISTLNSMARFQS